MIAVIDYGVGNLFSLSSSLAYLGLENKITRSARELDEASHIILPGVGAFGDAMEKLASTGLVPELERQAENGKPLLGICLGMQLLFESSEETPGVEGLKILPGKILRIPAAPGLKIPHMGWNSIHITPGSRLFAGLPEGAYVYFVHSYYLKAGTEDIVAASTEYGTHIHAAVESKNVCGCQFHPEKSSSVGLQILKNFASMEV